MALLRIATLDLRRLSRHLLSTPKCEQGAFLFCSYSKTYLGDHIFTCEDWVALTRDDYDMHLGDYLELADATRARLIKQAHDRGVCLIESHSHPGPYPAEFSYTDLAGFAEFIPHVRWRLCGRPYAALVFSQSGFDGLAWVDAARAVPSQVAFIETENARLKATGLTMMRAKKKYG